MPDFRSRPSSRTTNYAPTPEAAPSSRNQPPAPGTVSSSQQPPAPKKKSKSSIFSIFSRPNVDRAKGHSEHGSVAPVALPPPDVLLERPDTRMSSRSRPSSRISFASRVTSPPRESRDSRDTERPSSRLSFRFLSGSSSAQKTNPQPARPRPEPQWEAPPLFQAYPQALKHTLLKTPGPAFDPSHPSQGYEQRVSDPRSNRNSIFGRPMSRQGTRTDGTKPAEKWCKKVYVLVKSGHLLEYAGDGAYDRLPEKVLKLGQDSAAFASDLIPGFPYVLQVLQTASSGIQVVQMPQKTLRSRIAFSSATSRRITSNVLLVFDEPEQMDSWMIAIRREIEALGGKKCRPDSTDQRPVDFTSESPSAVQRYEVMQRNSNLKNHPKHKKSIVQPTPLPVISETSNGHPPEWGNPRQPSTESNSSSDEREGGSSTETPPTVESSGLSEDWFTDLAPPGDDAKDTRTSTDTFDLRPVDATPNRMSQETITKPPSINGSIRPGSSFSTPRYSLSPLAYAHGRETPDRPSSALRSRSPDQSLGINDISKPPITTLSISAVVEASTPTPALPKRSESNGHAHPTRTPTTFRTGANLTPLLTPTFQHWTSPSPSLSSPTATSTSPTLSQRPSSPPSILRRPPSLPVHSDPVPFLSAMAKAKASNPSTPRTPSIPYRGSPATNTNGSVLVPIVRPPSISKNVNAGVGNPLGRRHYVVPGTPGSRPGSALEIVLEAKAVGSGVAVVREGSQSAQGFVKLPPQMPPPTSPLPVPPGIAV